MTDKSRSSYGNTEPLFHDVSPRMTWVVRGFGIVTVLMIVIALIICIVRAEHVPNAFFYLLACNNIMSCFIGVVNAWWYRRGHLASDKHWYLIIVAIVIIWQCIATDVYVFHSTPGGGDNTTSTTASFSSDIMTSPMAVITLTTNSSG